MFYCCPDAETIAGTPDNTFRTCGLTSRKGEYIRDIAQLIVNEDLDAGRVQEIQGYGEDH